MKERGNTLDIAKPKESLAKRKAAVAKTGFYLGLHRMSSEIAEASVNQGALTGRQRRANRKKLTDALFKLSLIKSNGSPVEPFYNEHPDIAGQCEELLDQHVPSLQETEALYEGNSEQYNRRKRMKIAFQKVRRFRKMSGIQPEQFFTKESDPESEAERQAAAAKIDFYLGLRRRLTDIAGEFVGVEPLTTEHRKEKSKRLTNALLDLYLIKSNGLIEEPFYDRYPDISAQCDDLLKQHMPELLDTEALYESRAGEYDAKKRMKIALQVAHRFRKLSNTQKEQIVQASGYTPKQSIDIARKLTKAGALTGVLAPLSGAIVAAGSAYAYKNGIPFMHLGSIDSTSTQIAVGVSYAVQYGMAYPFSRTNHALLEDPEVRNAPDVFPAVAYMLTKRFLPEVHIGSHKIDVPKASTQVGTVLPIAWQEPAVIAFLFVSPVTVFARNMIGGAITGAEAFGFKHSEKARKYLR